MSAGVILVIPGLRSRIWRAELAGLLPDQRLYRVVGDRHDYRGSVSDSWTDLLGLVRYRVFEDATR